MVSELIVKKQILFECGIYHVMCNILKRVSSSVLRKREIRPRRSISLRSPNV